MIRKRKISIMIILIVSTLFAFTPQVANAANLTIKIGALGPMGISLGIDMKNGADLAVSEINTAGGITITGGTYDFLLQTETTSGSTGLPDYDAAVESYNKLMVAEVSAVLGGFRTEVVLPLQFSINATEVPFLGVGSTAPIITEYYYRVGPPNGTTLARNLIALYGTFLGPVKGVTKAILVREDAAWASAVGNSTRDALGAGTLIGLPMNITIDTTLIAPIPTDASSSDVATALNPLLSLTDTQAILTLFSAPVGRVVTEQWAALGLNDNMYLAGINVAAQDSKYFENTGGAAAGEIAVENAPPGLPSDEPTPTSQAFRDTYLAEYDEAPTYTAFAAYDSVFIIKDAIERADSFESADIHGVLPSTDYFGVAARYKFTNESSAGQVASPAVPEAFKKYNNTIVHDLYTPSTIGKSGFPYSQLYYGQWQEDGTKVAIWATNTTGYAPTIDPPYVVETTTTPTDTTLTTTAPKTTDITTDAGFIPAFHMYMVIIVALTLGLTKKIRNKQRRH